MDKNISGRRIKQRLKDLGKSQTWLADRMNVSDNAISKWVRGLSDPTLSNLRELAEVLECSVGFLAGDEINDDVAAIANMARKMDQQTRIYYRKSGNSLVKPDGNNKATN